MHLHPIVKIDAAAFIGLGWRSEILFWLSRQSTNRTSESKPQGVAMPVNLRFQPLELNAKP